MKPTYEELVTALSASLGAISSLSCSDEVTDNFPSNMTEEMAKDILYRASQRGK